MMISAEKCEARWHFPVLVAIAIVLISGFAYYLVKKDTVLRIETTVLASMKEYGFGVEKVTAIKNGENRYRGLAKIIYKGIPVDVEVEITSDGSKVIWKIAPGELPGRPF